MAEQKRIILVTGANSGIGFGLAQLLLEDKSNHVLVCSRSIEKGEAALKDLQSLQLPGSAELLQLDVTDASSIDAAAKRVEAEHGHLDCLVNNAAVSGFDMPLQQAMTQAFAANAIGPALTVEAFADLLRKSSTTPRLISVSSGGGSIGGRLDPKFPRHEFNNIPYRSSKSALSMVHACHTVTYGKEGWKVFTYCPGFTVSNLSSGNTAENGAKPTVEGARPMLDIIYGRKDDQHGEFLNNHGGTYSW